MQQFFINEKSTLPYLRLELIDDGRYGFMKSNAFDEAIQNADVTFTMKDERGILKISKSPCSVVLSDEGGCNQHYLLEYRWKERDTKIKGKYSGSFEISFKDDIFKDGMHYPSGKLIVPITEQLEIYIR